jgi:hypothetical protein
MASRPMKPSSDAIFWIEMAAEIEKLAGQWQ